MNVMEAAKSGKPYRRSGWDHWLACDIHKIHSFTTEDILSQDWEVKDDGIIITREEYWDAVAAVMKENNTVIPTLLTKKFELLLEKLGL